MVFLRFQKPCSGFPIFLTFCVGLGGACHLNAMRYLAQAHPNANGRDNGTQSISSHDCLGKPRANQQCPERCNQQICRLGMPEHRTTPWCETINLWSCTLRCCTGLTWDRMVCPSLPNEASRFSVEGGRFSSERGDLRCWNICSVMIFGLLCNSVCYKAGLIQAVHFSRSGFVRTHGYCLVCVTFDFMHYTVARALVPKT